MTETQQYRYRYVDCWDAYYIRQVFLCQYPVIKLTRKGAWIKDDSAKERFVLNGNGRRYAYETLEWAKESYFIRKRKQEAHLKAALTGCAMCLRLTPKDLPENNWKRVTGATEKEILQKKQAASFSFDWE